jgi:hypothetical protein
MSRLSLVALALTVACKTDDETDTTETDTADDTDTSDDTDTNDTDDSDTEDTEDTASLTANDLAGWWSGNNPSEACYATLFANTVVQIAATDDQNFTITDGTNTFPCSLADGVVTCDPVSGASNPTVGEVQCEWPYEASIDVTNASEFGFDVALSFTTSSAANTGPCAVLTTCTGTGSATFTPYNNASPAPAAMVKESAAR